MNYEEIGKRIREYRKLKNLSQEQLAEKINISTTHMSHIETGSTKLSLQVLVDIAKVLNNADASYVLDIFPAREKQEDYPDVTSNSIIKEIKNGFAINDGNWDQLKQYDKECVVIFMSPKEIKLMQSYKEYLKN